MNLPLKLLGVFIVIGCVTNLSNLCAKADDVRCHSCKSNGDGITCALKNTAGTACKTTGKCYTNIINEQVVRGCVGDQLVPNEDSLKNCLINKKCEVCRGDSCNSNLIRDTCIKCKSSENTECKTKPGTHMQSYCSVRFDLDEKKPSCFLNVDGGTYERGCTRDLSEQQLQKCTDSNNENCQLCSMPNCNQKSDFNMNCYQCNDNENPYCVRGTNLTKFVECKNLTNVCVTYIQYISGNVVRDCYDSFGVEVISQFKNEKCYTNLCNKQPFDQFALQCYQCAGSNCKNVTSDQLQKCAAGKNSRIDQCYTYIKDGKYYRGCMSDDSDGKKLCFLHPNSCQKCNKNGCNSKNISSSVRSSLIFIALAALLVVIR